MAYVRTTWITGSTPLSATNMNKIEDGIFAAHNMIAEMWNTVYPVGCYFETSVAPEQFNPNTAFGGTWILEKAGQVHVSAGSGYPVSGALSNTSDGGNKDAVIPYHRHSIPSLSGTAASAGAHAHSISASSVSAGGHKHDISASSKEAGSHSHTINASSESAGAHSHTITSTCESAGSHTHTITASSGSGGAHNHTVAATCADDGAHTHGTGSTDGRNNFLIFKGTQTIQQVGTIAGEGHKVPQVGSDDSWGSRTAIASAGSHRHTISTSCSDATGHTHTITASSASAGGHTHSVSSTSGSADSHKHTISASSVINGAHTHTITASSATAGGHAHTINASCGNASAHSHSVSTVANNTGYVGTSGNTVNANMQPYINVYRWHRTA